MISQVGAVDNLGEEKWRSWDAENKAKTQVRCRSSKKKEKIEEKKLRNCRKGGNSEPLHFRGNSNYSGGGDPRRVEERSTIRERSATGKKAARKGVLISKQKGLALLLCLTTIVTI